MMAGYGVGWYGVRSWRPDLSVFSPPRPSLTCLTGPTRCVRRSGKLQRHQYADSIDCSRSRSERLSLRAGLFDRFSRSEDVSDKAAVKEDEPSFEPPYSPFKETSNYEIRLYDSYAVAETFYDKRPEGIAELASYMDGENRLGVKLPTTQPVLMQYTPSKQGLIKTMRLYLKTGSAGGTPPLPNNPAVQIQAGGAELVAVLTFSGNITPQVAEDARARLTAALERDGLDPKTDLMDAEGSFRVAQYGPLFSLMPRRNELWLRLSPLAATKLSQA